MVVVVVMAFRLPRQRIRKPRVNWMDVAEWAPFTDRKLFNPAPPAGEGQPDVR
jgi:hypothetical protein